MAGNDATVALDASGRSSLVDLLAFLRSRGSALLVVGNVPADVHHAASRQMLGTHETAVRRRVLALTVPEPDAVTDRLPTKTASVPSAETTVISYQSSTRGTAAADVEFASNPAVIPVEESSLGDFLAVIYHEIERFERTDVDDPATFRFCLDSLSTLLSEHDQQTAFRFLHLLIGRIRAIRAIGHVHLESDRSAEHVTFVEPLFDAVVELGIDDQGQPQQRWQLTDHDVTSRWLPLDHPAPTD